MDSLTDDFNAFIAELERVCPEAVNGLAVNAPPPQMLSLQDRIGILRSLPDGGGVAAFLNAWRRFATENPHAVIHDATPNER